MGVGSGVGIWVDSHRVYVFHTTHKTTRAVKEREKELRDERKAEHEVGGE